MIMKKGILLILLLNASLIIWGQQSQNWIDGELIIQLNNEHVNSELEREFANISLSEGVLISKHMNIWKFKYDPLSASIEKAIELLYLNKYVETVQRNHVITKRATTPNDPDYSAQWQYFQANDKDIDADEAWDITTGGLTSLGDTIVVCVIDDGVNLSHPDLIPNLWRNYNEIPGNGIDDDLNGYIDDVRGWNAYNGNDDISHDVNMGEGHGSAVAGIVGAKGNNNTGVSGVNWNVKIMVVKGGGIGVDNEAQAIEAYSYVLENRKLYNATNGQKGAFVVATNASWGVDGGTAASAPLWCAMYDTLGNYGVLSAGATANNNVNVDVDGDLPTQCASDFLIAVTNTNNQDVKETFAGYGVNSIDLGAPGEGTWTVDQFSNGYAGFGGTSGASPHVAGTIGLLYSVPCLEFANLAKTNPKLAAQQIKDYILNNVDANSSLNGITSTGGRLNVNESVQAMVTNCSTLSIQESKHNYNQMSLYPNPVIENSVTISINSNQSEIVRISVIDLSGKLIQSSTSTIHEGDNEFKVKFLYDLSPGTYFVSIVSRTKKVDLRFVK